MVYDFQREPWFMWLVIGLFVVLTSAVCIPLWIVERAFQRWLRAEGERRMRELDAESSPAPAPARTEDRR